MFFLDLGARPGEVEGVAGAVALADGTSVPVLRLTGVGKGGPLAARRGLLPGALLWPRGLVTRARGASWTALWMTPLGWWFCARTELERKRLEWLLCGGGGNVALPSISGDSTGGGNVDEEEADFL